MSVLIGRHDNLDGRLVWGCYGISVLVGRFVIGGSFDIVVDFTQ